MSSGHAEQPASHWSTFSHVLSTMGHPLVPSPQDTEPSRREAHAWADRHRVAPRVLIMGVTRALYELDWPSGTVVTAMDNSRDMITNLWPGPPEQALCCDWRDMCIDDSSVDLAVCDGGLIMVPYPHETARIASELVRVLVPGGVFVTRLYVPSWRRETPEEVIAELRAGRIPTVNHLKLRFWAAVQRDPTDGVCVGDVWDAVHRSAPDFEEIARSLGWSKTQIRTLDPYRNGTYRYYLPTVEQIVDLFTSEPGGFVMDRVDVCDYAMAEQSPTLVVRRRS